MTPEIDIPEQGAVTSVPNSLEDAAAIYRERNKVYGDNYKEEVHGAQMQALFPNGVTLNSACDHARFGVLTQMATKFGRYANMFARGGHADSLDDLTVYAQMLKELDAIAKAKS